MAWRHFIALPEEASAFYEKTEEDLAEFLNVDGFDVLLPVRRTHHPYIRLMRLIQSNFSYLINKDYEVAKRIMPEQNNKLSE